jgi:prepilin-type N-terminal cleavage/methylation domain-containing protein
MRKAIPASPGAGRFGFTIIELIVSAAVLSLFTVGAFQTLLLLNRNAATARAASNARILVQRNIAAAMGASRTSGSSGGILSFTSGTGAVWDDDGGGDGVVGIVRDKDGGMLLPGTLVRTVTAEPNSMSADIRRVSFRLDYVFRGRPGTCSMTTIRSMD